jgi:dynein heavy chain, axonemal
VAVDLDYANVRLHVVHVWNHPLNASRLFISSLGPRPAYWLSCFFSPLGFIASVKHTHARTLRVGIDTLHMGCEMTTLETDEVTSPPPTGVYIYGLSMEGGRFDRVSMCIEESSPRLRLDPLPCIQLKPEALLVSPSRAVDSFDCPLYRTSVRTSMRSTDLSSNFIVSLPVPCREGVGSAHWAMRGCAMLCVPDN